MKRNKFVTNKESGLGDDFYQDSQ